MVEVVCLALRLRTNLVLLVPAQHHQAEDCLALVPNNNNKARREVQQQEEEEEEEEEGCLGRRQRHPSHLVVVFSGLHKARRISRLVVVFSDRRRTTHRASHLEGDCLGRHRTSLLPEAEEEADCLDRQRRRLNLLEEDCLGRVLDSSRNHQGLVFLGDSSNNSSRSNNRACSVVVVRC